MDGREMCAGYKGQNNQKRKPTPPETMWVRKGNENDGPPAPLGSSLSHL